MKLRFGNNSRSKCTIIAMLAMIAFVPGCLLRGKKDVLNGDRDWQHLNTAATQIEYPDVDSPSSPEISSTPSPLTLADLQHREFWNLSLKDAVQISLANSKVLRDLGGLVLQSPGAAESVYGPSIQETDPRFGVDAALSAFDASLSASAFFEKNDRAVNNEFLGGGTRVLAQDLGLYQFELSKRTAIGTDLVVRNVVDYDWNNSPGNNDPSLLWTAKVEAEFRQPLLQGAGVDFNRIAGPSGIPGLSNGVLIARVNSDISLADFEAGVRNLVSDVENAYWELFFAYRNVDALLPARRQALETWRRLSALDQRIESWRVQQSLEKFYELDEEVKTSLAGRPFEKNRVATFRGQGGVHAAERRLRFMMGIPASDDRLIRPADEPLKAKVMFNWDEILAESLLRRVELRRQKWQIKRREMEVRVAENYLKPRLDAVGRYRFRGLGRNLISANRDPLFVGFDPNSGDPIFSRFNNAYQDLTTGDFQEWQLGMELTMPVGYRRAHAAVRNAQLQLTREKAVLEQQEREISHDLSTAIAELERAFLSMQTNYNRLLAAQDVVRLQRAELEKNAADPTNQVRFLELLVDSERREADAEQRYSRSLAEYVLSVKRVHFEKGSLLDYSEVYLSEGAWPGKAYHDAGRREQLRKGPSKLASFIKSRPPRVDRGPYPQRIVPNEAGSMESIPAPPADSRLQPLPPPDDSDGS